MFIFDRNCLYTKTKESTEWRSCLFQEQQDDIGLYIRVQWRLLADRRWDKWMWISWRSKRWTMVGKSTYLWRWFLQHNIKLCRKYFLIRLNIAEIHCPVEQSAPRYGAVDCSNKRRYGSECTFSCPVGYFLFGTDSMTCHDSDVNGIGEWSGDTPFCERK